MAKDEGRGERVEVSLGEMGLFGAMIGVQRVEKLVKQVDSLVEMLEDVQAWWNPPDKAFPRKVKTFEQLKMEVRELLAQMREESNE